MRRLMLQWSTKVGRTIPAKQKKEQQKRPRELPSKVILKVPKVFSFVFTAGLVNEIVEKTLN